ncbi:MAG TPA: hypothetical protein PKI14_18135 [Fervidobacterium sp.]|nr:hypothetical protein [Fervidobacterium sp.]HUM44868.1 hypothetical protein [Fervidobacterium sp.]
MKYQIPDCETPGSIEDLIIRPLNEEARKCINEYIKCMKNAQFKVRRISKSILYSYIAVQNEPSKDLTTAIKRNQINIKDDVFDKIKSFLKSLA